MINQKRKINKSAVIVETRPLSDLKNVILDHLKFLDEDWKLEIFSTVETITECGLNDINGAIVHFINPINNLNEYNTLLTSIDFWSRIKGDKVLIFQHDSKLLRKGIDEFLEWDYVGAPWRWQDHGGNGGLSLRARQMMIEVIEKYPFNKSNHGNEDVYFSNHLQSVGGLLAPRLVCKKFACEALPAMGTLGVHAIEKWLSEEQCKEILNQYK